MGRWVECRLVRPLLSAFLEGSLNLKMSKLVDEHLVQCAECRSGLEPIDRLAWDLYEDRAGTPAWTASREFRVRLEGALHHEIGRSISVMTGPSRLMFANRPERHYRHNGSAKTELSESA